MAQLVVSEFERNVLQVPRSSVGVAELKLRVGFDGEVDGAERLDMQLV